jgi:hypothetical protein
MVHYLYIGSAEVLFVGCWLLVAGAWLLAASFDSLLRPEARSEKPGAKLMTHAARNA